MKPHKRRTRKQRRQQRATNQFGRSARPTHTSRSGRTGKIFATQLKSGPRVSDNRTTYTSLSEIVKEQIRPCWAVV